MCVCVCVCIHTHTLVPECLLFPLYRILMLIVFVLCAVFSSTQNPSYVMRVGNGVMTFIERARLFESAGWHFKSHQDQLFCSVFAVERV